MSEARYVALLRGINAGGGNIIRMADLRGSFETIGFAGVATYIVTIRNWSTATHLLEMVRGPGDEGAP
jgi:uncharacterized protein (DUF1697 family)